MLTVVIILGTAGLMFLSENMANFYPWYRPARTDAAVLLNVQVALLVDLLGWEYLVRGFLLFALIRRGDLHLAVVTQALIFFVLHENKPTIEFIFSLPGGVVAGYFVWRSKSFLPLWWLHALQLLSANACAFLIRNVL